MAEPKENRELLFDDAIRQKFLEGAKEAYDAAARSYGPRGLNAAIEKGFGKPVYSRDGITILRDVFSSDRAKNMGIQAVVSASEESNQVAGDGSTAVALLTYHILNYAMQSVAAGNHPMEVSEQIIKDSYVLLEKLKSLSIPVKDDQLKDVATISAGDPLIGQLIAEAILYVGVDGGILTEKAPIREIERSYIDGYYLQSGFTALQSGKKELIEPFVVISSKRMTSGADAIDILNGIAEMKLNPNQKQIPRIIFIGNFEDMAYQTIVNTINQGQIDAIILKTPPMYGELGKQLLEDIALYANCQVITENTSLKSFDEDYIGTLDKVIANKSEATLFGDNKSEVVQERIKQIKDQIESEEVPAISEKLRDRVAKLEGKIAIFKIGAPQDNTREEIVFRVEDAINSTRHAYAEGIVPGGGVTLLELSKLDISDISRKALRSTFKQLLINANLPAELKLDEALRAKPGHGYNLRESDKLVDVVQAGVIDPYVVIREIITHATGMAAETIKVGLGVIFTNTEK